MSARIPRPALAALILVASACGGGGDTSVAGVVPAPINVVGTAGGTVSAQSGAVTLAIPAGALGSPTQITVQPRIDPVGSEHTVGGTVHEFGPSGTQFAQPVTLALKYGAASVPAGTPLSSLRIAKLINGEWVPSTEAVQVDSANGVLRSAIRSFSTMAVVRDPCVVPRLPGFNVVGTISRNDCLYRVLGRRSDYYSLTVAELNTLMAGNISVGIWEVASTGPLTGLVGIKDATTDPTTGTVWASGAIGSTFRITFAGKPLQLFVSGEDSTRYGDYRITIRPYPGDRYVCGMTNWMTPHSGTGFDISESSACKGTVTNTPFPPALGKPLLLHFFVVKLDAGVTYTFRASTLSLERPFGLTLYQNGRPLAQRVPATIADQSQTERVFSYTPTTTGNFVLEVSSGILRANGQWETPGGPYQLAITSNAP